jgi:roadblock/LC7 domain-containing protein
MATIDDLVKIHGVVIAFEFAPDGTLAKYKANVEVPPNWQQWQHSFAHRSP